MNDAEFRRRAHALLTRVRPKVAGYPLYCGAHDGIVMTGDAGCKPTCEFVVLLAAGAEYCTCDRNAVEAAASGQRFALCGQCVRRGVKPCAECGGTGIADDPARRKYRLCRACRGTGRREADPPPAAPNQVTSPQR